MIGESMDGRCSRCGKPIEWIKLPHRLTIDRQAYDLCDDCALKVYTLLEVT